MNLCQNQELSITYNKNNELRCCWHRIFTYLYIFDDTLSLRVLLSMISNDVVRSLVPQSLKYCSKWACTVQLGQKLCPYLLDMDVIDMVKYKG